MFQNECKDSCLWEYVLVSLILSTTYINYKNDEENGIDKHIILLIILGILIWLYPFGEV